MRRRLEVLLAVLALPVAICLVLLAVDVLLVSGRLESDDLRFHAAPTRKAELWDSLGFLPGGAARRAAGVEDDLAYRRAVALLARVQPGRVAANIPEIEALRGQAQLELTRTSQAEDDGRRRAHLLNFLGALSLDRIIVDFDERANVLRTAIGTFQNAVKADPEHADAKHNLELALRDAGSYVIPGDVPSGERSRGRRSGAGSTGGGY